MNIAPTTMRARNKNETSIIPRLHHPPYPGPHIQRPLTSRIQTILGEPRFNGGGSFDLPGRGPGSTISTDVGVGSGGTRLASSKRAC